MSSHTTRVGSLSWNSYILSSGARSGQIIHHDVRQRDHAVATLAGHSQEVTDQNPSLKLYQINGGCDYLYKCHNSSTEAACCRNEKK